MKYYYKIKFKTDNGNAIFSVGNAGATKLPQAELGAALDKIIRSTAVKSSTGQLRTVEYVQHCKEEKVEMPIEK